MNRFRSQTARSRWGPIVLLVAANLLVGFLLAPHYGQSTDEAANLLFAQGSLASYQHPEDPYLDPVREDKGPFYLMVWLELGQAFDRAVAGWEFVDGRHFVNFLAFQLALVSVYALAIRFVKPTVALAATLLFETQPVLFGHAFINQKDSPFMAFFAATMALGVSAFTCQADARKGNRPSFERAAPTEQARQLYEQFVAELRQTGLAVHTGVFGEFMQVRSTNDGPVVILLDSKRAF